MKSCLVFFLLLQSVFAHADNHVPALATEGINKDLLVNANAVLRAYSMEIAIDKTGKGTTVSEDFTVTVFNEQGKEFGNYAESYGSIQSVLDFEGMIFDKNGKYIQKIKKSDVRVSNSSLGSGYYDDAMLWSYTVKGIEYPYTIKYHVVYKQNHTFYIPSFIPEMDEGCAVEKASLTIKKPATFSFNYRQFGYDEQWPQVTIDEEDDSVFRWECGNIKAQKNEPLAYRTLYTAGTVIIAPVKFNLENYVGDMSSWERLSSFVYDLNDKKDKLPEHVIAKVKELTANETDIRKKVAVLYKYLQDNTRYVAIEYGINGWQTLDATYTATNKYGDCKALSYYMKGLLSVAGIQSNAVLVYAGEENDHEIISNFPCVEFNHMILMVPLNPDTIWLECTSKDLPAGYLSDFTQNRNVLVLAHENGGLIRTPVYDTAYNMIRRNAVVKYGEKGSLIATVRNNYFGEPAVKTLWNTARKSVSEIDHYASSKFSLASYDVITAKYESRHNDMVLEMSEECSLKINYMVTATDNYLLLDYDVLPLDLPSVFQAGQRLSKFRISKSSNVIDSFVIELPDTSKIYQVPTDETITTTFGIYKRSIRVDGTKLIVLRQFTQRQGLYDPELFTEYQRWLRKIEKDGQKNVILGKS